MKSICLLCISVMASMVLAYSGRNGVDAVFNHHLIVALSLAAGIIFLLGYSKNRKMHNKHVCDAFGNSQTDGC